MASAAELERKLRAQPDCFELKANEAGKSDVWKHFALIFEKDCDDLREMKYFCACNSCRRVYAYKSSEGVSFGTKNLLDHVRHCTADKFPKVQMTLSQCVQQTPKLSKADISLVKQQEVKYCVDGYHSFRSVEHKGLRGLLQTCVDLGAKYGKMNVEEFLTGRKAVSRLSASKVDTLEVLRSGVRLGIV